MTKLSLWQCDNGTYDLCDEEGVVVQNVPASALLDINVLLEAVELLKTLRNHIDQYDDGEWYLHEGGESALIGVDLILEKLK